jgi:hypothetical protein
MDDSTFNGDVTTIFWITLNILNAHPPKKKHVFFFGLLLFGATSFTSRNNPRTSNPGEGARLRQLQ